MYTSAEQAYAWTLRDLLDFGHNDGEGNLEKINHSFVIENLDDEVDFSNKVRKFNKDYAEKFFRFIMEGGTDASELFAANPNAKNFVDDLASRNTAYGPRILAQIPGVVQELKVRPASRRAVITILNSEDQVLLPEKQSGSRMEYPCTISLTFLVRNKRLNLHVGMRSNNMTTTINYDLYNFINVQKVLLEKLNEAGMGLSLGKYYHVCASAHILVNEIEFAKAIIEEYNRLGVYLMVF